jgi:hypothetical protein
MRPTDRLGVPDKAITMNTWRPELFLTWLRRSGTPIGLAAGYFMQRTRLIILACTLLVAPFFGSAAPNPGCADPIPASTWRNLWCDGSYQYIEVGDGLTYWIRGFNDYQSWPDTSGQWDWIVSYSANLCLANVPGTSWYSSSDTNVSFYFQTLLLQKMRGPRPPSTNAPPGYLEMELSAQDGQFICLAAYAGTPRVTDVPEDPDTCAYTVATAPLSWARLCVGSAVASPGIPVTIRRAPTSSPQVELSWGSFTNRLYQLQCGSDLSEHQWTNLGSPIAGTSASHCAVDAVESQKFYRILEFP